MSVTMTGSIWDLPMAECAAPKGTGPSTSGVRRQDLDVDKVRTLGVRVNTHVVCCPTRSRYMSRRPIIPAGW